MSGRRSPESRAISALSKSPMTYEELERELDDMSLDVNKLAVRMTEKRIVKNIGGGCRRVLFVKERQRKEADIKSLGRYALGIYNVIKRHGPTRSSELTKKLGVRADRLAHSADNLVNYGYVKRSKTLSQKGGDLYYISITKDELRSRTIGPSEEIAYSVIRSSKRPVRSAEIAQKMGISTSNASGIASRVVMRGLAYAVKIRGSARSNKIRDSVYYTDSRQKKLAEIISVSPLYGEAVYAALSKRPKGTPTIAEASGLDRGTTYQVLKKFRERGVVGYVKGFCRNPSKWYLLPPG